MPNDIQSFIVKPPKNDDLKKNLMQCGIDSFDFVLSKNQQFDAFRAITKFEPDIRKVANKVIGGDKQRQQLLKVMRSPLRNYTMCICSFPTDKRAKALATNIMMEAYEQFVEARKPHSRTFPLWHNVYGSLGDPLRDRKSTTHAIPSLLVLSNITADSSNYKLEKVRDLLVKFSNIPRIVVVGGSDPYTFFAEKLYYPLTYGILLGADNKVVEV